MVTLCIKGASTIVMIPVDIGTIIEVLPIEEPIESGILCAKNDNNTYLWNCFFSFEEAYGVWEKCYEAIESAEKAGNDGIVTVDFDDGSGSLISGEDADKMYQALKS